MFFFYTLRINREGEFYYKIYVLAEIFQLLALQKFGAIWYLVLYIFMYQI